MVIGKILAKDNKNVGNGLDRSLHLANHPFNSVYEQFSEAGIFKRCDIMTTLQSHYPGVTVHF
jgi:hypothetical protein